MLNARGTKIKDIISNEPTTNTNDCCVRVFQRDRTNGMSVCVCLFNRELGSRDSPSEAVEPGRLMV